MRVASQRNTRPRKVDVFRKLPILRCVNDEYQDEDGTRQTISASDLMLEVATAPVSRAKKLNIPICPVTDRSTEYEAEVSGRFKLPVSYIRTAKTGPDVQVDRERVDYVLEYQDMRWIQSRGRKAAQVLDDDKLEKMIDALEKATGTGPMVTQDAAEKVLTAKMGMQPTSATREVVADVYQYWLGRRTKNKKALLRRFWPVTAADDTNPHMVFRPREKERYKLRKHRRNDMDSFRKLQQLRRDCERVRTLLELVCHREQVKQLAFMLSTEHFEQSVHDMQHPTPGAPTRKQGYDANEVSQQLAQHRAFVGLAESGGAEGRPLKRAKRVKSDGGDDDFEYPEGIGGTGADGLLSGGNGLSATNKKAASVDSKAKPIVPSFMEPYGARNTFEVMASKVSTEPMVAIYTGDGAVMDHPFPTPWNNIVVGGSVAGPHDASSVDSATASSDMGAASRGEYLAFSCRGRVGRGGRIIFDRTPRMGIHGSPGSLHMPPSSSSGTSSSGVPLLGEDVSGGNAIVLSGGRAFTSVPASFPRRLRRRKVRFDRSRLSEIYAESDSEEEDLKQTSMSQGQQLGHGVSLKFEVRV